MGVALSVIAAQCHRTGCGSQRPLRARFCTCVLLAAAPTTPPCFRHWRRSSLLPSRGASGKEVRLYEMPRAPLLAGAVAAGDWGVVQRSSCRIKPHRHCFAMPPPLVGAALAKRSSFTRCQAMMPERLDKSTATHRPPLALPSGELSSDSETERVRPSKSDETRNAARAFQPRAAFPVFPFCFMLP